MNSKENSTTTPAFAMPRGDLTAAVDVDRIAQMSAYEIWSLQGSIHTIGDIIGGLLCQPKHYGDDDNYNLAGRCLEGIAGWLSIYEQAVVNMAEAMTPDTAKEAEWKAWTILSFEVACTDNLASVAVVTAQAVRDVQSAKFAEGQAK